MVWIRLDAIAINIKDYFINFVPVCVSEWSVIKIQMLLDQVPENKMEQGRHC